MKDWFAGLEQRERLTLIAGAVILVIALLWVLLIHPLYVSGGKRAERIEALRMDLQRAQQISAEIKSMARQNPALAAAADRDQSLMIVLERSARDSGLQVSQSRPMDASTVRVRFEQAPFDTLVSWMGMLATRYGIQVDIASLDKLDTPGMVDSQLTLKRPAT